MDMMNKPTQSMDEESSENEGYCIVIHVAEDGSLAVSSGPREQAMATTGTPVGSIDEATQMVYDIYQRDGQTDNEDQFSQGFGPEPANPQYVRVREGE